MEDGGVEGFSAAVAGVVENLEAAGLPAVGELPGDFERTADVVAPVDEDTGDAVEFGGFAYELVFLQKCGMAPVVGHQSGEAEAKFRLGMLKGGFMPRRK